MQQYVPPQAPGSPEADKNNNNYGPTKVTRFCLHIQLTYFFYTALKCFSPGGLYYN